MNQVRTQYQRLCGLITTVLVNLLQFRFPITSAAHNMDTEMPTTLAGFGYTFNESK